MHTFLRVSSTKIKNKFIYPHYLFIYLFIFGLDSIDLTEKKNDI